MPEDIQNIKNLEQVKLEEEIGKIRLEKKNLSRKFYTKPEFYISLATALVVVFQYFRYEGELKHQEMKLENKRKEIAQIAKVNKEKVDEQQAELDAQKIEISKKEKEIAQIAKETKKEIQQEYSFLKTINDELRIKLGKNQLIIEKKKNELNKTVNNLVMQHKLLSEAQANLNAVKQRLEKYENIESKLVDVNAEHLSFIHEKINNISRIGQFKKLTTLDLTDNAIRDISPIQNLPLSSLSLNRTQCSDLSAISEMNTLQQLSLVELNKIRDFSFLENLTNLTFLNLTHTKIKNLDNLKYLKNLKSLYLGGASEVNDFKLLETFKKLEVLDLSKTKFNNIDLLWKLPLLKEVNLTEIAVSDTIIKSLKKNPDRKFTITIGNDKFLPI